MDKAVVVNVFQPRRAVQRKGRLLLGRDAVAVLSHECLEAAVLHKLQHDQHGLAHRHHAHQPHDVGVLKLRHHRSLLQQLLSVCAARAQVQRLDRHEVCWDHLVLLQQTLVYQAKGAAA